MTIAWRSGNIVRRTLASSARPETPYDLIAIVASTGGIKALEEILQSRLCTV